MKAHVLLATLGLGALAFGDSFIVAGSFVREPVHVVTASPCEVLETRSRTGQAAAPLPRFESRIYTALADTVQEFRSDPRVPLAIFVR